jgi:hypothetical protein
VGQRQTLALERIPHDSGDESVQILRLWRADFSYREYLRYLDPKKRLY